MTSTFILTLSPFHLPLTLRPYPRHVFTLASCPTCLAATSLLAASLCARASAICSCACLLSLPMPTLVLASHRPVPSLCTLAPATHLLGLVPCFISLCLALMLALVSASHTLSSRPCPCCMFTLVSCPACSLYLPYTCPGLGWPCLAPLPLPELSGGGGLAAVVDIETAMKGYSSILQQS